MFKGFTHIAVTPTRTNAGSTNDYTHPTPLHIPCYDYPITCSYPTHATTSISNYLLFDNPADRGSKLLRNVDNRLPTNMVSYLRRL
jgi:hypothetical protein